MAPWTFATSPASTRRPSVVLAAFSHGRLGDDAALAREPLGIPETAPLAAADVRTIARAADPRWFDAWRGGSLRAIAERDLGAQLADLDAADHVHVIALELVSPAELSYLQVAWGLARQLVARGATTVLDVHAMMYRAAAAMPPADGDLDVSREVRVIYETDSSRADRAHAMHTRGLRKFGAPDLVALCGDADARLVGPALVELAGAVARGTDLVLPRHAIAVAPGITWYAVADEHQLGALLQLNNAARVIVDSEGHDLLGVLARLPAASN